MELRDLGSSNVELIDLGSSNNELRDLGSSSDEMRDLGSSSEEVRDCSFTEVEGCDREDENSTPIKTLSSGEFLKTVEETMMMKGRMAVLWV